MMDDQDQELLARLIRNERVAHLATLRGGAPMASMAPYLPAPDFSAFYVRVSRLAWHTQDMLNDARVALSIAETDDVRPDPYTLARVSVRGEAAQLAAGDEEPKRSWLDRFPEHAVTFELPDFSFWKITPRDARFIAGFGRIHQLSGAQLVQCAGRIASR